MAQRPELLARLLSKMNPPVFLGSAAVVIGFVLFGTLFTELARQAFDSLQSFIVTNFGWFYILSVTGLLGVVLWLLFSRYGDIRLGGEDTEPEFGYLTWFSMMMSAGMGIGVVFFGVAEPMLHYLSPPVGDGETPEAVREAMRYTFFHWGLHPWAVYSAIALPLAYFHFRHKLPLAPRSLLYPLLGRHINGIAGHVVDVLCTVGTLFGVATSLGLGAMQINTGLNQLADVPVGHGSQVMLIAIITAIATISVVSGIHMGIRRLSEFNMGLAALILLFILATGPTLYTIELFISSLGYYLQRLVETSFWIDPGSSGGWQADWTLFYWSWWLSWSPFVGIFVARISRGRTIREFILAAFLAPTLMVFFWFAVVGGTGLYLEQNGAGGVAQATLADPTLSLYAVLDDLPWFDITSILATLLIVVFFITSSDSGSLVDDMVTSGGHPNPPRAQRVFWAVAEGAVAATLLLAGDLTALRTASLTTGLPVAILLLIACYGLIKVLRVDLATPGIPEIKALAEGVGQQSQRDRKRT